MTTLHPSMTPPPPAPGSAGPPFHADRGAPRPRSVLYDSSARESIGAFLLGTARELYAFRHATASLVLNGLRNRYRRSVLGWSWSLLEPLLWTR